MIGIILKNVFYHFYNVSETQFLTCDFFNIFKINMFK
jgi:hypothetical protein